MNKGGTERKTAWPGFLAVLRLPEQNEFLCNEGWAGSNFALVARLQHRMAFCLKRRFS